MSLTVAFGALGTGIVIWFLLVRRLTVRTWEVQGDAAQSLRDRIEPAKVGLLCFLAVVTSLFALFLSAYYMRMGDTHGIATSPTDWRAVTEPPLLWVNTAVLVLASLAMQWSGNAASHGDVSRTRLGFTAAGVLTAAFLVGQVAAWILLADNGYFTPANPAAAFFVVLTALHGLHLLGGLAVWARSFVRLLRPGTEIIDVRRSIGLCATYWHYLLLVWLALFAVLLAT